MTAERVSIETGPSVWLTFRIFGQSRRTHAELSWEFEKHSRQLCPVGNELMRYKP